MKKLVSLCLLVVCFIGLSVAVQPKIAEFNTSFGETFSYSEYGDDDASALIISDKEVQVKDDMEVELCVTEVNKDKGDKIEYRKLDFNNGNHGEYNDERCKTWQMNRDDYAEKWRFDIRIKNQDDIGFSGGEYDYQIIYRVSDLQLSDGEAQSSDSESVDYKYSNYNEYASEIVSELEEAAGVELSPNVYGGKDGIHQARKNGKVYFIIFKHGKWESTRYWAVEVDAETGELLEHKEVTKGENEINISKLWWTDIESSSKEESTAMIEVEKNRWEEMQNELEEKNQRINELQQRIRELENRIQELTSQVNQSESSEDVPVNQGNNDEDLPGSQQAEENRPGFVNSLLGSIFG